MQDIEEGLHMVLCVAPLCDLLAGIREVISVCGEVRTIFRHSRKFFQHDSHRTKSESLWSKAATSFILFTIEHCTELLTKLSHCLSGVHFVHAFVDFNVCRNLVINPCSNPCTILVELRWFDFALLD
ncbi:hypothetical protein D9M68_935390 [compost metagenome]